MTWLVATLQLLLFYCPVGIASLHHCITGRLNEESTHTYIHTHISTTDCIYNIGAHTAHTRKRTQHTHMYVCTYTIAHTRLGSNDSTNDNTAVCLQRCSSVDRTAPDRHNGSTQSGLCVCQGTMWVRARSSSPPAVEDEGPAVSASGDYPRLSLKVSM